jgi:hypothetical protein
MQDIYVWLPDATQPSQLENVFGCLAKWEKCPGPRKKLGTKALEMHRASLAASKQSFTVFVESSAMSALLHMPSLAPTFIQETKRFLVALDGPGQAAP